jgi:hypothetical protein
LVFCALYGREFTFYSFALLRDARMFFLEFAHRDKPFGLLVKVAFSLALKFRQRFFEPCWLERTPCSLLR